jgi:hypothetical protein
MFWGYGKSNHLYHIITYWFCYSDCSRSRKFIGPYVPYPDRRPSTPDALILSVNTHYRLARNISAATKTETINWFAISCIEYQKVVSMGAHISVYESGRVNGPPIIDRRPLSTAFTECRVVTILSSRIVSILTLSFSSSLIPLIRQIYIKSRHSFSKRNQLKGVCL